MNERLELCDHARLKPWERPGRTEYFIAEPECQDGIVMRQVWRCAECGIVVATASRRADASF